MWLFDGKPELVDANVAPSTPAEGGYVVVMVLTTGVIRLAATNQPTKYVKAWRRNAQRCGIPDIVRVLVSRPYIRYEAIKRVLADLLNEYRDADTGNFRVSIETLTEKTKIMWAEIRRQP